MKLPSIAVVAWTLVTSAILSGHADGADPLAVFAMKYNTKNHLQKLVPANDSGTLTLLDDTVRSTSRLVLDDKNRKVYWIDWFDRILVSPLDDTNKSTVLVSNKTHPGLKITRPNGLAYDPTTNML